jgi:hypothetical protein
MKLEGVKKKLACLNLVYMYNKHAQKWTLGDVYEKMEHQTSTTQTEYALVPSG